MRFIVTGKRSEIELNYAAKGKTTGGETRTRVKFHVRGRVVNIPDRIVELCADEIDRLLAKRVLVEPTEPEE